MFENAAIRRSPIKTDLDQPNRLLSTSSFFIHPSNFRTRLWFLANNKNTDDKHDFRDHRQLTDLYRQVNTLHRHSPDPTVLSLQELLRAVR